MKLCWNLLCNKEDLWVRVLRAKYKCGDQDCPKVRKKKTPSFTWRGICEVWDKFKMGVCRKIGNGISASFWFDNWSEMNVPLIDLIPGFQELINKEERVVEYVNSQGDWDREKLNLWFLPSVVNRITCVYPPSEERGEDKYVWKQSSDGRFTIKSAYQFLSAGTHRNKNRLWRMLWRWPVLEKIKAFMWLFSHNRAHTAQLRARRGINQSAECPFGCGHQEDSMHLLRDCSNAMDRWKSVVSPSIWNTFFALEGEEWVKWNLEHNIGLQFTKKIRWPILFGYICWDIWVSRCNRIFGSIDLDERVNALSSFFKACLDQDLLQETNLFQDSPGTREFTHVTPIGFTRLEVDGSVLEDGRSGCGGVITISKEVGLLVSAVNYLEFPQLLLN